MKQKWVVFDLIGVLAEPSWRELVPAPDLERWSAFKRGQNSEPEFWEETQASLYRTLLRFRADRLVLVETLRERGYKICIATNFSTDWYNTLHEQLRDKALFADCVISSEIGVAKPEPGFWEALLRKVPAGSVFVDDRKENCDAASEAGFRAVWAYPGAPVRERINDLLALAN